MSKEIKEIKENKKSSKKNATIETKLEKKDLMFDEAYALKLVKAERIEEVKQYVKKFFFRYKKEIFFFDGVTFDLYSQLDAIKMIPNDLCVTLMIPDEISKKFKAEEFCVSKYLKSTDFMKDSYKPTIDFTKPLKFSNKVNLRGVVIKDNFINMAKPYAIDKNAKPVELTDYIVNALKVIDDHMLNVLCSKNEASFRFNKNFFACTFAGRKLRKCLYWQSLERTGKGTFLNGLIKLILGDSMYKTSSVETITTYTKPLEGCVLVNADELPVEGNCWKSVGDKLKGLITEPEFDSRTMHQTAYTIKNTFNMIITTNNNAVNLTMSNHQRYHTNDIDESRIGDKAYFKMFTKIISDPLVRLAYYQQMMLHYETLSNWNEDDEVVTNSKQAKMTEALPQFHKYMKEKFVLRGLGLDMKTSTFFETYFDSSKDRTSKIQIGKYLTAMSIEPIKRAATKSTKQHYRYTISAADLHKIFLENKWLDPKVDLVNEVDIYEEDDKVLQQGVDKRDQSVDIRKMYAELEAKYNLLLKESQVKEEPIEETIEEPDERPVKVKKIKKDKTKKIKPKPVDSDRDDEIDDLEAFVSGFI